MKCPRCGAELFDPGQACQRCGSEAHIGRRRTLGEAKAFLGSRFELTTANEMRIGGFLAGLISLFFSSGVLYVYPEWDPSAHIIVHRTALDLIGSGDPLLAMAVGVFITGLVLALFYPRAVILQLAGLVMLSILTAPYMESLIPSIIALEDLSSSFVRLGLGYYLAWVSTIFVFLSMSRRWTMDRTKHYRRSIPPSERITFRRIRMR